MIYLSDFGLTMDLNFDLNKIENNFFNKNIMHDFGRSIMQLEKFLFSKIEGKNNRAAAIKTRAIGVPIGI